jgi:hypothetical protein
MSKQFTDEERREIMDEGRAALARLNEQHFDAFGRIKAHVPPSGGDAFERWRKPQSEPQPRERALDRDEIDCLIGVRIAEAVAAERERQHELLIELTAAIQDEADAALEQIKTIASARETRIVGMNEELHQVRIDLANARADVAELRAALTSGGNTMHERPNALGRRVIQ